MKKVKLAKRNTIKTTVGDLVVALSEASKFSDSSSNDSQKLTTAALQHLLGNKISLR